MRIMISSTRMRTRERKTFVYLYAKEIDSIIM